MAGTNPQGNEKFWSGGEPFQGLLNATETTTKFWDNGLPSETLLVRERAATAKVRLKILGVTSTVQAKVLVKVTTERSVLSKTRVKYGGVTQIISATARIKATQEKTVSPKVWMASTTTRSVEAKMAVLSEHVERSVQSKIRLLKTFSAGEITAMLTVKGRKQYAVESKVRIYKTCRITKYSHFIGTHSTGHIYTNSTTFTPTTDAASSSWLCNKEHFSSPEFFLEFAADLYSGVTEAEVRLYNISDGAEVANSTQAVTTDGRYKVGPLTLDTMKDYIVQVRVSAGTGYVLLTRPRILIVQTDNSIQKTETIIPISGEDVTFDSTEYTTLWPTAIDSAGGCGVYTHDASMFDGTVEAYLEAHFGASSNRTSYIRLFDMTSNSAVTESEISNNGTATRVRSVSFSLEDGKQYSAQVKSSGLGETEEVGEIRLIIYQNGLTEANQRISKTLTWFDLRQSYGEGLAMNTSYTQPTERGAGFGAYFNYEEDYSTFSPSMRFSILGRKATDAVGSHYFRVYDLEDSAYVTSEISEEFPFDSKSELEDTTLYYPDRTGVERLEMRAKKDTGGPNAFVSLFGMWIYVEDKTKQATVRAKTRIVIDSIAYNNTVTSNPRTVSGRVEIMWDGVSWTDESQYLISAKGNQEYTGKKGEILADQCDIELDNTTKRFLPENEKSSINQYLKPEVPIRFSIGINGLFMRVFTGRIQSIDPNRKSGVVNFGCLDNTVSIINRTSPSTIYLSKRFSEIVEILAQNCGLESDEYLLEESPNIAETVWFEDKTTNEILTEIVAAERGRIFFDTSGNLVFWNKFHIARQQPMAILDKNNWLLDFSYKIEESEVVNKISIKAKPRKPDGLQVVWSNGQVVASNQYSNPLVWVPAQTYQNAWIEIDDPAVDWQTPVAGVDFFANTLADGTGADITSNIEVTTFVTYKQQAFLSVNNNGLVDAFLTDFSLRANPLKVYKWIRTEYTDDASIAAYGVKDLNIENNWIATEELASEIKEAEVNSNKNIIRLYDIEILGRPDIQAGEVVSVETADDVYESFNIKQNDWSLDFSGYIQKLQLIEREVLLGSYDTAYGIGSGIIGGSVVGVSALTRGRLKSISAKVAVKRMKMASVYAKVGIAYPTISAKVRIA